jgi:hypothetical protein
MEFPGLIAIAEGAGESGPGAKLLALAHCFQGRKSNGN